MFILELMKFRTSFWIMNQVNVLPVFKKKKKKSQAEEDELAKNE